ncbi:hypothetical protein NE611_18070, partial [Anaerostipes caccae]|nr:hypothetical protein [Anaerostipes caccae]
EDPQEYGLEIKKEQDHTVKVQDFYPETGCALSGEQVRLSWFVQNAQKLFLYTGASKKEIDPAKSSELVIINELPMLLRPSPAKTKFNPFNSPNCS